MEWRLVAAMVGRDGFPAVVVRLEAAFAIHGCPGSHTMSCACPTLLQKENHGWTQMNADALPRICLICRASAKQDAGQESGEKLQVVSFQFQGEEGDW